MRLHPFTPFLLTLAVVVVAFLAPPPAGPLELLIVVVWAAIIARHFRPLGAAFLLSVPLWFFLLLLHGAMAGGEGWSAAVAQGARLSAIILASLMAYRTFQPARFLDATAMRGWSPGAALLVLATLQAAPRLRDRVNRILEAQRSRGLRIRGRPVGRLAALPPVALPLILQTMNEVDARTLALETRAAGAGRRTALRDVRTTATDWMLLIVAGAAVVLAGFWRIHG